MLRSNSTSCREITIGSIVGGARVIVNRACEDDCMVGGVRCRHVVEIEKLPIEKKDHPDDVVYDGSVCCLSVQFVWMICIDWAL